jgi:predicted amidophosphoribosyltransferase
MSGKCSKCGKSDVLVRDTTMCWHCGTTSQDVNVFCARYEAFLRNPLAASLAMREFDRIVAATGHLQ